MLKDFREFISRGNVIDLAVAFIVGVAFTAVVTSLVNDVIMPPIGLLLGDVDFRDLFVVLREGEVAGPYPSLQAATDAGAVTWRYGLFVNTVITFVIVSFAVFLMVRSVGRMTRRWEAAAPTPEATTKSCPYCVSDIPITASRCPYCTSDLREAAG